MTVGFSEAESALMKRFELAYARSTQPVMRRIERRVCGCDYGGNSWTTRSQANRLIELLGLGPGSDLIDLGAGTGWPGLYLAQRSGCSVALVDLPEVGIRIAAKRAESDGIGDRTLACIADASELPFGDACFDAISHSDLLCCLATKLEVLRECRRIIRHSGRMVFTVISIRPGLDGDQHARALSNAPEFVEVECDYALLLEQTGWQVVERTDLTEDYRQSCARQVQADRDHWSELVDLLGADEAEQRLDRWISKLAAIEDGLFLREQISCRTKQ